MYCKEKMFTYPLDERLPISLDLLFRNIKRVALKMLRQPVDDTNVIVDGLIGTAADL